MLMHYILIANYGNHSLAALQHLIDQAIKPLHVIYVDTGWSSPGWAKRVETCEAYAQKHQLHVHHIKAIADFRQMVMDRKQFPSSKFQWCAGFLKGLALLDKIDAIDPFCEAIIVSGKRRLDSKRFSQLNEYIEDDEYYNGRRIWHPLWQCNDHDFQTLIEKTGFEFLNHPSRECSPCIHASISDLQQLEQPSISRLNDLEQQLGLSMFEHPVCSYQQENPSTAPQALKQFDLGCGSPWCCGE